MLNTFWALMTCHSVHCLLLEIGFVFWSSFLPCSFTKIALVTRDPLGHRVRKMYGFSLLVVTGTCWIGNSLSLSFVFQGLGILGSIIKKEPKGQAVVFASQCKCCFDFIVAAEDKHDENYNMSVEIPPVQHPLYCLRSWSPSWRSIRLRAPEGCAVPGENNPLGETIHLHDSLRTKNETNDWVLISFGSTTFLSTTH